MLLKSSEKGILWLSEDGAVWWVLALMVFASYLIPYFTGNHSGASLGELRRPCSLSRVS
jgi:hypothetical protein